jgi:hypothetical protein
VVVLFAADPAAWVPRSSRTRLTDVGPDGRFQLTGLRSGKYLIVAVKGAPVSAIYNNPRATLDALAKHATEISVGDEERRSIDLKVVILDDRR